MTKHEKLMQLIAKEREEYLASMSQCSTAYAIAHAYEMCYREEIAMTLLAMTFDDEQLDFLLTLPNPIGFMYSEWLKTDASVCEMLEDTIRDVIRR